MENNTTISGNKTTGTGNYVCGGGVRLHSTNGDTSKLTMKDNASIIDNSSYCGGGIYISTVNNSGYISPGTSILCMQNNTRIAGNTAISQGGGIFILQNSGSNWNPPMNNIFQISDGIVYGNYEGINSNHVNNGTTEINGMGAAIFRESNTVVQYGTFSGDIFTSNGNLSTTDNTINVMGGELQ